MPGLPLIASVALLLGTLSIHAQTCSPNVTQSAAEHALSLQTRLLALEVSSDGDDTVMPANAPTLHDFKQALLATVDAGLRCNNPEPAAIERDLTRLLQIKPPPKPQVSNVPEPQTVTHILGANLGVASAPIAGYSGLYSIQFGFGIPCGDDNILLLYRRDQAGWHRVLVYMNPDVKDIGDALGDFFTWSLVPGPSGQTLFAAAHGTPWCTSRMSMFGVDLITLSDAHHAQRTLAHRAEGYSRFEHQPALTRTADGFQLRVWDDSLAFDSLFIRPRIWRFRTTAGQLERIQPIAENARDFVDVWLQLPWPEAAKWSDPAPTSLQAFQDRFDYSKHADGTPNLSFGPVHACSTDRFQVELDLSDGPKLEHESAFYALVRRSPTAFTLLSIDPQPDPTCTGPDIMKPRKQ